MQTQNIKKAGEGINSIFIKHSISSDKRSDAEWKKELAEWKNADAEWDKAFEEWLKEAQIKKTSPARRK